MKNRKITKVSMVVAALQVGQQSSGTVALANTTAMPVTTTPTSNTGSHTTHDVANALTASLQNSSSGGSVHHHIMSAVNSTLSQQASATPTIHAMVSAAGYQSSVPTTGTTAHQQHFSQSTSANGSFQQSNSATYTHSSTNNAATSNGSSGNTGGNGNSGSSRGSLGSGSNGNNGSSASASGTQSNHHTISNTSSSNPFSDLDLTSSQQSVVASSIPHFKDVTIQLQGGTSLQVTPNTKLTESEAAAVYQVLTTGNQGLVLNSTGIAAGGTLNVNHTLSHDVTELVIPQGVTVDDKVGQATTLNLANGLTNNGTLDFISAGSYPVLVTVSASNIINGQGAQLLLTQNASGLASSSPGTLALQYSGVFTNYGLISSAGGLTVTGSSSSQAPLLNTGTMQASHGDLSLNVAGLTNSGTLQALNGNLNISGAQTSGLTINNSGGHLIASNAIDINATPSTSTTANLNLNGGIATASSLNFVAANNINVTADELNGAVNLNGANALISVSGGTLNIASANLSGDPFLSNNNGNVVIGVANLTTSGAAFTALASGDVTFSGSGTIDTTTTSGAQGGNVLIGSGVTFNGQTITGASSTGGDIDLGGLDVLTNGGNVTLVANAGTSTGTGGAITIGDIDTHAAVQNGVLNGGSVTVTAANATSLGNITTSGLDNASGAGGSGGAVSVTVTQPGASLTVGTIDTHGGAGGNGASGTPGNGGDGGDGGSTFTASNFNLQGTGGTGGTGGTPGALGGAGGTAGGAPGNQGATGTAQNGVQGGTGGNGGAATPASGSSGDGGDGGDGLAGQSGGAGYKGYDGGDAGNITIKTSGAVSTGSLLAYGGAGGGGGNGGTGGQGGNGGNGGHGDYASAAAPNTGQGNGTAGNKGGDGGNGGNAGDTGDSGNGNDGGDGGKGGQISVTTGGSLTIAVSNTSYQIDVSGGAGGSGGSGGRGQTGANGGDGGDGASGGNGGLAGSTYTPPPPSGGLGLLTPGTSGNGGDGGKGGNGGNGADGADGGDGGKGGNGGDAGTITIVLPTNAALNPGPYGLNISIAAGAGGSGGDGGGGGAGGIAGGDTSKGLQIGQGGPGGLAGMGFTTNSAPPGGNYAIGPASNGQPGTAGANGTAGTAGQQGNGGDGGDGGSSGFNGSFIYTGINPNIYNIDGSTYVGGSGSPGYMPGGGGGGAPGSGLMDGNAGSAGASTVTSGLVSINGSIAAGSPGNGGSGGSGGSGGTGGTGGLSGGTGSTGLGSSDAGLGGNNTSVLGSNTSSGGVGGTYFGVPGAGTTPLTSNPGTGTASGTSSTVATSTFNFFTGATSTDTSTAAGVNDTNISQELVQSKEPQGSSSKVPNYQSSTPTKTDNSSGIGNTSYLPEPYRDLIPSAPTNSNRLSGESSPGSAQMQLQSVAPESNYLTSQKQPIQLVAFAEKSAVLASASASALPSDVSSKAMLKASALNAVVISNEASVTGWLKNVTTACAVATTLNQTGNYLVVASEPTVIYTKFGKVSIARGADALVCYSDEYLNVLNLADNSTKSVIVESGSDSKRLHVGQQFLISKDDAGDFASINQLGQISWRRPVKQTFNGYRAFVAEFSVVSAIQQLSPLQQLLNSDDKQSKKFITNLLKVAVLISNATR